MTTRPLRFSQLRAAAETFWPTHGAWAYDRWHELNEKCFAGALRPLPIIWALTPHGHSLGHCSEREITLHPSLVNPRSANPWGNTKLGELYAADVLLHEMCHQSIHEAGVPTGGETSHNSSSWVDVINRVGPIVGVKTKAMVLKQRRVDGAVAREPLPGFMTQKQLSTWPHCLRPASYYKTRR